MRQEWERARPMLEIDLDALTEMIRPAFAAEMVVGAEPAAGGLANTNLRVRTAPSSLDLLVRIFERSPQDAAKEVAVVRHVAERVPVPRYYHFADSNPATGHPYVVAEWIDAQRLETVAAGLDPAEVRAVGAAVGAALAGVHSYTFSQAGFLDAQLRVAQPITLEPGGLADFLRTCLVEGAGAERIASELTARLIVFAQLEGVRLGPWPGPPRLTHADFGGSNILVRKAATDWQVAAVLDWEFAFSGVPAMDFGNLLRPALGLLPGFEQAVAEGYRAAGGALPAEWRRMSLLTDLTAWAEFMARPHASPALIRDATAVFERTMADWHGR